MSDNPKFRVRNKIQVDGKDTVINSQTIDVLLQDVNEDALLARGTAVPTADGAGYAKGCLFIKTDAGDGTKGVYENQGTNLLADFNLIGAIDSSEIANDAVTTVKILDDNVTSDKLEPSLIKFADVTLTATQIKALAGTNIELVPATEAGAGFTIIPIAVLLRLTAGTEVLVESSDNLNLLYSASTVIVTFEMTGFIDQATNQNRYQGITEAVFTPVENTALDLNNDGGDFTGNASNDAVLNVRTYYRVVPVV